MDKLSEANVGDGHGFSQLPSSVDKMSPEHDNQLNLLGKIDTRNLNGEQMNSRPFNSNSLERPSINEDYFEGVQDDLSDKFEKLGQKQEAVGHSPMDLNQMQTEDVLNFREEETKIGS